MYKAAAQLRQEVKQKAKRIVEKEFLSLKVSGVGAGGQRLSAVARADKHQNAVVDRIHFLKEKDTFHHGNLKMPDPEVDSSVRVVLVGACTELLTYSSCGSPTTMHLSITR